MQALGIGDLHFDGPLKNHLPDLNARIAKEIRSAIEYGLEDGSNHVIFYGDIAHKPELSLDAHTHFLDTLWAYRDEGVQFYVMLGNHDVLSAEHHSMHFMQKVFRTLPHVTLITKPEVHKLDGVPFNFLPWPHTQTKADAVNVLHVEVYGSHMDSGVKAKTELQVEKSHFCVAGHLHTAQTVGSVHYSGTLFQVSFGEKRDKFKHTIIASNKSGSIRARAELIPHAPEFRLHNVVIESASDLKRVPKGKGDLCKLFVANGVDLPTTVLDKLPSVVMLKSYKTKQDLQEMIQEEFALGEESFTYDHRTLLADWLKSQDLSNEDVERAHAELETLIGKRNE